MKCLEKQRLLMHELEFIQPSNTYMIFLSLDWENKQYSLSIPNCRSKISKSDKKIKLATTWYRKKIWPELCVK